MSVAGLDRDVAAVLAAYQTRVDGALPGRLEGLVLFGSLALDDYRPGQSDVDVLAIASTPWTGAELRVLAATHTFLSAAQAVDLSAVYVTWTELAGSPLAVDAPHHLMGRFSPGGAFDANPAVWETVSRYPRAIRGPTRPTVHTDPETLTRWSRGNLDAYWRDQAARLAALRPVRAATAQELVWCVSGVARLARTIAAAEILSKTGALLWAREAYGPRWASLAALALSARTGEPPPAGARPPTTADVAAWMAEAIGAVLV